MLIPVIAADGVVPASADFRANILFPALNVGLVERALRPPDTGDNRARLDCLYQPRASNPLVDGIIKAMELERKGNSPSNPLANLLQRELYEHGAGRLNLGYASEEQAPNSLLTYNLLQRAAYSAGITDQEMASDFAFRGIFGRHKVDGQDDFSQASYSTITGMIAHHVLFGYDRINPGENYYKPVARMTRRMHETLMQQGKTSTEAQVAVMRYSRDLINLRNTLSLRMNRSLQGNQPENSIHVVLQKPFDINKLRSETNEIPLKHPLANCIEIAGNNMIIPDGSIPLLIFANNPAGLTEEESNWLIRDPDTIPGTPEVTLYKNLSLALSGTNPIE